MHARWPLAVLPAVLACASFAQDQPQRVVVTAPAAKEDQPFGTRVGKSQLSRWGGATSDSARMLEDAAGISLYGAGGVSSLPAIHGLADDRLRIQVDGMDLVAACPNHMNPALSYIDPTRVGNIRVYAGITPVSVGGDSIGGTIRLDSAPPVFADAGESLANGRIGGFVRSSGSARGGDASANWANEQFSVNFTGAVARQENYRAAKAFKPAAPGTEGGPVIAGDVVASTAYTSRNRSVDLAWRRDEHLVQLGVGDQRVGFEGFPNQRMDMTGNQGSQFNLRYTGRFEWGELIARAYRQDVQHRMDMGPDRYRYGFGMPMDTEAHTRGGLLQGDIALGDSDLLRLGAERQTYLLYDWWPPVGGSMGPNAFWNIDNGRRNRSDVFVEWESRRGETWLTQVGLRNGRVMTDAARVQGYDNGLGALWGNDAAAFNARDRRRVDDNWDAALLARWTPNAGSTYEAGYALKVHSPNLYHRYAWSTQPMAALMNNFVGDGNGYIGNPDLKPEAADTVSFSADWHDARDEIWGLKATGYLTQVGNYIDARRCNVGSCGSTYATTANGFVLLQYVNQSARLSGLDLTGHARLFRSDDFGTLSGSLVLSQINARNRTTGDHLYNIMPLNARLAVQLVRGGWTASAQFIGVEAKRRVSQVRNEMPTPGYGLVNLRMSYAWKGARLDLGVENLANRAYALPLGGAYLGQGPSMTTAGIPWGIPVPGPGRSIELALNLQY